MHQPTGSHSTPPADVPSIDRRALLRGAAVGAAALGTTSLGFARGGAALPHVLPELPYPVDSLEPIIGKRIMELHHGKHHAGYVKTLNEAVSKHPELADKTAEELVSHLAALPEAARTAVRNAGGGHVNHTMFWEIMSPKGGGEPKGEVAEALVATFGDLARFKEAFNKAGAAQFGSGWVWLTMARDGKLAVESTPNQDTPLSAGKEVILGNDVWEHAYYLTYENRRADYLNAWWKVVDWDAVTRRYEGAKRRIAK